MIDRRASVHDDEEPGMGGPLRGFLVPDIELHPHRLRADLERLLDVWHHEVRPPEQVYHLDAFTDVLGDGDQVRIGSEAMDRSLIRVDRDDLVALADEEARHAVRGALRVRRAADDGPDAVLAQDALGDPRIAPRVADLDHRLRASSWRAALMRASSSPSVPATAPAARRASVFE